MNKQHFGSRRGKMVNGFDPSNMDHLDPYTYQMVQKRAKLLGPAYRLFYDNPIEFVRAKGVFLYDNNGDQFLDAYNNVVSVGHCNEYVNESVKAQMDLISTHTRYVHKGILNYAEKLLATFEDDVGHLMFTCSGSEANDLALRMAKYYTGNEGIIVTSEAYHGNSGLTSSFSPSMGENTPLGTSVRRIPAPDTFRVKTKKMGEWFAGHLSEKIEDLKRAGHGVAAFVADSLFTSDGIFAHDHDILKPVAKIVREGGGLMIADEVQCGFGRTGTQMWGYQRHDFVPDIISLGKPMGNGYPIAGIAVRPEVARQFGHDMRYFNTFGGNTVAVAAANATFEFLENQNLKANAARIGDLLRAGVRELAQRDERIGDVRGAGLYTGVEIVKDRKTNDPDSTLALKIVNEMRQRRVLLSATAFSANVLKIRPPLIFDEANVDQFLTELEDSLKNL